MYVSALPRTLALLITAILVLPGCATSFQHPSLEAIAPYRTDGLTRLGEWEIKDDVLYNLIPADVTPTEIDQGTDGAGVSLGLIEGAAAHDVVIDADVTFEPGAAVGPVVFAREADGTVYSLYWLALYIDGATLWRFDQRNWVAVGKYQAPMNPAAPHTLRIEVEGPELRAYVDKKLVMKGQHSAGAAPGRLGVMVREGIAGVRSVRYAVFDRE